MKKTWCVYRHENKVNGKVYIGITSMAPSRRWDYGRGYRRNKHFYSSIVKYGWDSFSHEVLFDDLTKEQACQYEQALILAQARSVICLNTQAVFGSVVEAGAYCNLSAVDRISDVCKNKRKSAGKKNGESLRWMYYEDYIKEGDCHRNA